MDLSPEHYFQCATQRMRQAQHLYHEGSSFALAIYVGGLAYLKEEARQFLNSAQRFIDKGVVQWRV
jgi:hypothetical protein